MTQAKEPAFPDRINGGRAGLTKREYIATKALQGLLSAVYSDEKMLRDFLQEPRPSYFGTPFLKHLSGCDAFTKAAINYADSLIAELSKEK